ncbi:hypothetical protein IFM89_024057 [Coptis chinensis]|uniref:Uncharacterized protein n=1 Tax=Coptis chinensis TaxID=261450 RepID=A0A835M0I3_9MAGN|nr:hypothetical protein IFM89_024057 [Coptis chinensis]
MEEKREIMWCSHENFKAMVKENWQVPIEGNPFFILIQKLKRLKKALKTWNKETFGHLPTNIKADTQETSRAENQEGKVHNIPKQDAPIEKDIDRGTMEIKEGELREKYPAHLYSKEESRKLCLL